MVKWPREAWGMWRFGFESVLFLWSLCPCLVLPYWAHFIQLKNETYLWQGPLVASQYFLSPSLVTRTSIFSWIHCHPAKRLHFPASFPVRYGHSSKFEPIRGKERCRAWRPGRIHPTPWGLKYGLSGWSSSRHMGQEWLWELKQHMMAPRDQWSPRAWHLGTDFFYIR